MGSWNHPGKERFYGPLPPRRPRFNWELVAILLCNLLSWIFIIWFFFWCWS